MAVFTAAEALEMAKQIEETGEAFYRAAAEASPDAEVKGLFEELADQERGHYKVFQAMLDGEALSATMPPSEEDEYAGYVRAALDSALFAGPDKALAMAKEARDSEAAVRAAIGFEKDTMLFYYDLREMVAEAQQATISDIIREEKRHLHRLVSSL